MLPPAVQRLKGKMALVTGAASGIGLAAAKLFHHHGAKVVIADIQDDQGQKVCHEFNSEGGSAAKYIHCDVSNEDDVRKAIDALRIEYGTLDIMYSNVGISEPTLSLSMIGIQDYDTATFERIMRVNVVGMFLTAKYAARMMIPAKRGSIIFTSSSASLQAGLGGHGYCTSKHAVVGLTKSLATDLGKHGIRVNCISPCAVFTPAARRLTGFNEAEFENWCNGFENLKGVSLKVEDVAEAALYLAGDESKYISGHNLVVDGGFSVSDSACNSYRR